MAFSPDGKTLASSSWDKTIKLWDVQEPTLDLVGYLLGKWYEFDEGTGDLLLVHASVDYLYQKHTNGFFNVGRWTHVGVLQSAKSPEEANRLLYEHYCRNQAWNGAFALLEQPMDQRVEPRLWSVIGVTISCARGDYLGAAKYQTRWVWHLMSQVPHDQAMELPLADALGQLAWYQELGGQFPEALKSAAGAVRLNPKEEASPLQANHAHALLLAGQYAQAAAIYQRHKGQTLADGGKWNDEIVNAFKLLRAQGHTHPDMPKIEALLGIELPKKPAPTPPTVPPPNSK